MSVERNGALGLSVSVVPVPASPNEGFEVLSRQECLRLLAQIDVGRVAVSVRALPAVLPVQFRLVGNDILFSALAGGELDTAVRDTVIAFEADHIDPEDGWSVVVTGIATAESEREFRIPVEVVSGRRIMRGPLYVSGHERATSTRGRVGEAQGAGATAAPRDGVGAEALSMDECLHLLATEEVGRLVVVLAGEPRVFPVNYALDGDAIVFRTAPGTKLEAISRSSVAFEVDRYGLSSRTGWRVVVEGYAQEVTSADGPGLRERLSGLPVRPWASGDRLHYVRIIPMTITGTRTLTSG